MRWYEVSQELIEWTDRGNLTKNPTYDPSADEIGTRKKTDTRKPVITLKMLNKLKKIRATRQLDMVKKQELIGIMYGQPDEDESSGGFM